MELDPFETLTWTLAVSPRLAAAPSDHPGAGWIGYGYDREMIREQEWMRRWKGTQEDTRELKETGRANEKGGDGTVKSKT